MENILLTMRISLTHTLRYPELEIYGLERFGRQRVLKEMSGVRIRKNKTIHYELGVRITISCRMMFDDYPLDAHTCQFQVGSCKCIGVLNNALWEKDTHS